MAATYTVYPVKFTSRLVCVSLLAQLFFYPEGKKAQREIIDLLRDRIERL